MTAMIIARTMSFFMVPPLARRSLVPPGGFSPGSGSLPRTPGFLSGVTAQV